MGWLYYTLQKPCNRHQCINDALALSPAACSRAEHSNVKHARNVT